MQKGAGQRRVRIAPECKKRRSANGNRTAAKRERRLDIYRLEDGNIMRVEFIIGYACAAAGAGLFLYVAACELARSHRTQLAKVALASLFLLVIGSCVAALADPPEGGPVQAIRSFFNMTQLSTAPGMVMALLCAVCADLATTLHPGEGDLGVRCACAVGAVCACLLVVRLAVGFAAPLTGM